MCMLLKGSSILKLRISKQEKMFDIKWGILSSIGHMFNNIPLYLNSLKTMITPYWGCTSLSDYGPGSDQTMWCQYTNCTES